MPYMIIEKGGEGVIFTEKWKALFFFFLKENRMRIPRFQEEACFL